MNNWTPDRPTKPGKYEMYVCKERRAYWRARLPTGYGVATVYADPFCGELALAFTGGGGWYFLADPWFDGAQWRPYVEPPDPFAEPVPSLRERVEALPRYTSTPNSGVVRSQRGHYLDRSEVLALLDEVTQ